VHEQAFLKLDAVTLKVTSRSDRRENDASLRIRLHQINLDSRLTRHGKLGFGSVGVNSAFAC
jgi:hypothetical protein